MEKSCVFMLTFVAALIMGYYFGVSYNRKPIGSPEPIVIKPDHIVVTDTDDNLKIYINGELQIYIDDAKTQDFSINSP